MPTGKHYDPFFTTLGARLSHGLHESPRAVALRTRGLLGVWIDDAGNERDDAAVDDDADNAAPAAPSKMTNEHVSCDYVTYDSSNGIFTLASFAMVFLCAATFLALIGVYRNTMIIKMSQPKFSCIFILALVLNSLSVVLRLGENTDLSCMGTQWLFHVSFNLAFSTLIVKVYEEDMFGKGEFVGQAMVPIADLTHDGMPMGFDLTIEQANSEAGKQALGLGNKDGKRRNKKKGDRTVGVAIELTYNPLDR